MNSNVHCRLCLGSIPLLLIKSRSIRFDEEAGRREQDQLLHGFREASKGAGGYETQSAVPSENDDRASHGSDRCSGAGGEGQALF